MNGAESLIRTAVDAGLRVCFANPGTTEMPLVAALDAVPGMRSVLGLFEGVCTGAADGYARMSGEPALTLLHLGPGFANGIANLHNARRARSAVVNLIGDHASWHLAADAPLTSDIESLARPVSEWVRRCEAADALAPDLVQAIQVARGTPGAISTLIVPHDFQYAEVEDCAKPRVSPAPPGMPTDAELAAAADALSQGASSVFYLGGPALSRAGLLAAGRIASATGARLLHETFPARMERGAGLPEVARLPYFPEQVAALLEGVTSLVCAGALEPVSFFGYPGMPSRLTPGTADAQVVAPPESDVVAVLEALAERLGAQAKGAVANGGPQAVVREGALTPGTLGRNLAALQPEGAIVMDEGITAGLAWFAQSSHARPHSVLGLTGGAIGQGLPCAAGAAIACPDRKVIALQADGSGMYTLQALWTLVKESLDVLVVICANRRYRILQAELDRAGIAEPGPQAQALTQLTNPDLDWLSLARGMGMPARKTDTTDAFATALERAFAERGPFLIEATL